VVPELSLLDYVDVVRKFCRWLEDTPHPELRGVTDGKAIGTYVEHRCKEFIEREAGLPPGGSSALGQDLPQFNVDIKATFLSQPQSSSPFRSIEEKIFGLPYNILLIVHTKRDTPEGARIKLHRVSYIPKELTADHRTSRLARRLSTNLRRGLISREEARKELAKQLGLEEGGQIQITDPVIDRVLNHPPEEGVITITFALQWRLNYNRFKTIEPIPGVTDLL